MEGVEVSSNACSELTTVDINALSTSSIGLCFAAFGFDLIRQIADLNLAVASC